jgi:outer membrane protein
MSRFRGALALVAIVGASWTQAAGAETTQAAGAETTQAAGAETMRDALARAYLENPDLGAARAELRGVDETVPQALAGWRPTVSVDAAGGYVYSDTSASRRQNLRQVNGRLSVVQPLYRGGRTIAATAQAEKQG